MLLHFFRIDQFFFFFDNLGYFLLKMRGTQICGRHVKVFGQTLLYLVLWANIAPAG